MQTELASMVDQQTMSVTDAWADVSWTALSR